MPDPHNPSDRLRSSLFARIYVTFIVSVLGFAVLAVALLWRAEQAWNEERIAAIADRVERERGGMLAALSQPERGEEAMRTIIVELERELDASVVVHPRIRGRRLGPSYPRPAASELPPPLTKAEYKQLRRGRAIVRRHRLGPPEIGLPLFTDQPLTVPLEPDPGADEEIEDADPRDPYLVGVVRIAPHDNPRRGLGLAAILLLAVLAGGAWPLARSLTNRLARLERTTRSLADGRFSERATVASGRPRDEIDRLALAFNEMADRLHAMLRSQQTLLANVSHELRTPIARLRVLVELLGERMARMHTEGEITDAAGLTRMRTGFAEMEEDLTEVDALINDLLTSGRLELGQDSALHVSAVDVGELCERAASRFGASVECPRDLVVQADALLLERLVRNLLANARRACPTGLVVVRARSEAPSLVIEIEDEGPGIPPEMRALIFEPFARLDAARSRDRGGVGLGLHLSRQIAVAHGGTLQAMDREDGGPGARFVIRI